MSFTKRALGALAAGALALPLLPSTASADDTPLPTLQNVANFCVNPGASPFTDVPNAEGNELSLAVRCLNSAITTTSGDYERDVIARGNPGTAQQPQGIGANLYGPALDVNRGQMASFIARMIDAASIREVNEGAIKELRAASGLANPFVDVPANNTHADAIKRLADAGIVEGNPGTASQPNGIGANRYGLDLPVTRAQMASFINRAVAYMTGSANIKQAGTAGNGFVAPANAHYYRDQLQAVHAANINGITSAGIAQGRTQGVYDSLSTVRRDQMARFIARTLSALNTPRNSTAQPTGQRILTLREVFSANFTDADRSPATRLASPAADAPATSERTFTATGLKAGVEYRITLVNAGNITRSTSTNNEVRFATTTTTGTNFAVVDTGTTTADIVLVNGQAPQNNTGGAGSTLTPNTATSSPTVVAEPDANGVITFTIEGEGVEDVVAVIYINGGGDQTSYQTGGGASPRLETDQLGRPVEFFGVTGVTRFGVAGAALPPAE